MFYKISSIFLIFFSYIALANAESLHCKNQNTAKNTTYLNVKKLYNNKIEELSGHKTISELSDGMLSRLIQAKSPMITKWIDKRGLDPIKQTVQIAKKWRLH